MNDDVFICWDLKIIYASECVRSSTSTMAMKLRLRSLESKQTLRIQVPNPCSLQRFKEIVSDAVSSSSPSSISSIQVSLNGKDELHAASPQASLHSLGVRSGDLIYYTPNPHAFSPQIPGTQASVPETPIQDQQPNCSGGLGVEHDTSEPDKDEAPVLDETLEFSCTTETESMEVDHGCCGCGAAEEKGLSVPYFLKKVLTDEVVEGGNDYFLLVISIHAVLLDSGFVGFEPVSGMETDRLHLSPARGTFTISLSYTLPELLLPIPGPGTENVVLKFQNLGNFVNVYGFLAGSHRPVIHQLCSDRRRFAPAISSVWKNHNLSNGDSDTDRKFDAFSDTEVFEFWKAVKDGLALPLMIDVCERSGLALPPCLSRIPTELKRRILEFLPGIHIAKMGCVSSEFRYLSADNELWKKKFVEEFGTAVDGRVYMQSPWKVRFAKSWMLRKHSSAPARHGRFGTRYSSVPFPRNYFMQHGLGASRHQALHKRKLATNCKLG